MSRTTRRHAMTTAMSSAHVRSVSALVAEGGYPLASDDAEVTALEASGRHDSACATSPSTPKMRPSAERRRQ